MPFTKNTAPLSSRPHWLNRLDRVNRACCLDRALQMEAARCWGASFGLITLGGSGLCLSAVANIIALGSAGYTACGFFGLAGPRCHLTRSTNPVG
eukprot:gene12848-biopygen10793